jgi:16S rRNA processing protein RimM
MSKYILVGKTRKTHGIKGGLGLEIEEKFIEDVLNVAVAFIKVQGKLLPYFVEEFEYTNKLVVKFEDVNSPQDALSITSKEFYIQEKDVQEKETIAFREGNLVYGKLAGFTIRDEETGMIGEILEVLEFPQQEMALIEYQGREVFIPLNEDLIVSIHKKDKVVLMDLPEGLLEL